MQTAMAAPKAVAVPTAAAAADKEVLSGRSGKSLCRNFSRFHLSEGRLLLLMSKERLLSNFRFFRPEHSSGLRAGGGETGGGDGGVHRSNGGGSTDSCRPV